MLAIVKRAFVFQGERVRPGAVLDLGERAAGFLLSQRKVRLGKYRHDPTIKPLAAKGLDDERP